jgi:hypothetical protein
MENLARDAEKVEMIGCWLSAAHFSGTDIPSSRHRILCSDFLLHLLAFCTNTVIEFFHRADE